MHLYIGKYDKKNIVFYFLKKHIFSIFILFCLINLVEACPAQSHVKYYENGKNKSTANQTTDAHRIKHNNPRFEYEMYK